MTIEVFTTKNGKRIRHEIDPSQIDQVDEISGDEQQVLVWCATHKEWEWHWLERDLFER